MSRSQRRPLRLYVGESESDERHASWLELFFDLVFVVAIAQLAHFLHDELTWGDWRFRGAVRSRLVAVD